MNERMNERMNEVGWSVRLTLPRHIVLSSPPPLSICLPLPPPHLSCVGTFIDFDLQAPVEKVLKLWTELLFVLNLGFPVGGDEIKRAEGVLVQVRRLT